MRFGLALVLSDRTYMGVCILCHSHCLTHCPLCLRRAESLRVAGRGLRLSIGMKEKRLVMWGGQSPGLVLALWLVFVVLSWTQGLGCEFSVETLQSLQSIYDSAGGMHWLWSTNTQADGVPWNFTHSSASINPCSDQWQYLNCTECSVTSLLLSNVNMTGQLDSSAFQWLGSLNVLEISKNPQLQGPLPQSLWSLSNLTALHLSGNAFSGTLSAAISNLTACNTVDLSSNNISGTLPSVWSMRALRSLNLNANQLQGDLPSALGSLSNLTSLQLHRNQLHGSIPSTFSSLSKLSVLDLSRNKFTGTLPLTVLSTCSDLTVLNIAENFLDGDFPAHVKEFARLVVLNVSYNQFHGHIPSGWSALTALTFLDISNNHLTGTVPDEIANLTALVYLEINKNMLFGPIPKQLGQLTNLEVLYFDNNQLSSSIPETLTQLLKLEVIDFSNNLFQGSLPSNWTHQHKLQVLNMSHNHLDGSLPVTVGQLHRLLVIDLGQNHFSGTIQTSLSLIPTLLGFFLENNHFHGTTNNLVNPAVQRNLSYVDISGNSFSGQLSSLIFQLPSLKTFSAMQNCLKSHLSSMMCLANQSLVTLALDGLHASHTCVSTFSRLTNAYHLYSPMSGSIPACLLSGCPRLRTLQLSGNGVGGHIPDVSTISPTLQQLALSHNQLIGTIPHSVQMHTWAKLDLSFNKLTGTLTSAIATQLFVENTDPVVVEEGNEKVAAADEELNKMQFFLNMNRLSGHIPHQLRAIRHIDILSGNLFDCDTTKSTLPVHDPAYNSYDCGSDNVNYLLMIWTGIVLILLGLLVLAIFREALLLRSFDRLKKRLAEWERQLLAYGDVFRGSATSIFLDAPAEHIVEFGLVLKQFRVWFARVVVVICLVFLPLYCGFDFAYSTYRYKYVWSLSIGYVAGVVPAITLSLCLACLLIVLFSLQFDSFSINVHNFLSRMHVKTKSLHRLISEDKRTVSFKRPMSGRVTTFPWQTQVKLLLLLLGNIVVVMAVNVAFIASVLSNLDLAWKQIIGVSVTIFKLQWNSVVYDGFRWAVGQRNLSKMNEEMFSFFASFMTFLAIFNHIISLYIAEIIMSPNCLYYTLAKEPQVDVQYAVSECIVTLVDGLPEVSCLEDTATVSTSYNPPFFYSFQCTSSLLSDFGVILVLRFFISGLLIPLRNLGLKLLQEFLLRDDCQKGWRRWMLVAVQLQLPSLLLLRETPIASDLQTRDGRESTRDSVSAIVNKKQREIFNAERFMIDLMTDASIVLTFGVLFPPLALIGCVAMVASTTITQLSLGRIVHLYREANRPADRSDAENNDSKLCDSKSLTTTQEQSAETIRQRNVREALESVNNACIGVHVLANRSLQPLSFVLAIFWGYFAFDILGDAVGSTFALPLPLIVALVPFLIQMSNASADKYRNWKSKHEFEELAKAQSPLDVEMSNIVVSNPITARALPATPEGK